MMEDNKLQFIQAVIENIFMILDLNLVPITTGTSIADPKTGMFSGKKGIIT